MSYQTAIDRLSELRAMQQSLEPPAAARTTPTRSGSATRFSAALSSATSDRFTAQIAAAARRHGVDPALVTAVIEHESGFDPKATSSVGAQGLMQLMPATAAGLGVTDAYDPAQNIDAGTRLLGQLLHTFHGNVTLALAGYDAGTAAVEKYGGVPPYAETQKAVPEILAIYKRLKAAA